jgi:hypothetical protein
MSCLSARLVKQRRPEFRIMKNVVHGEEATGGRATSWRILRIFDQVKLWWCLALCLVDGKTSFALRI